MSYIENLIKQYIDATGKKDVDINSKKFIQELYKWVNERSKLNSIYLEVLKSMNVDFSDSTSAEIGKGKFDSVVLSRGTTVITPYAEEDLKFLSIGDVIQADFKVDNGNPVLVSSNNDVKPANGFYHFMTHNPYDFKSLENWVKLTYLKDVSITIGIFGKKHDKDFKYKLEFLKRLRDKLTCKYNEGHNIENDNYFFAVSTRYGKEKIKNR